MDDETKKQPQMRFKKFSGEWEANILGDFFLERSERSSEGDLISVTINSGIVRFSDLDRHDNSSDDKYNYKVVKKGDIAYNSMRMWQGASGYSNYTGIVSPAYTVLVPSENACSKFFSYMFKKTNLIQVFKNNSQGMTSDTWNLKYPLFKEIKVSTPTIEEQEKISSFFEELDHLITLQQQQCNLLEKTKKAYLQKMFPKEGKNRPEIQFHGFTEEWGRKKLSSLMNFSNGINAPKENYGYGRKMISIMDILNPNPLFYDTIKSAVNIDPMLEKKYKIEKDDLVFVRSSEIVEEVGWCKSYSDFKYALYSGFVIRGEKASEYYSYFIELCLNYNARKQIQEKSGGSTRFNISQSILNTIVLSLPNNHEQQKIGNFFQALDELINQNQQKLENLKEMKKTLLNKMFI